MEQNPSSEANQKFPSIIWNSKVHYHTRKFPPPFPVLSQLDPVHTATSHILKVHLNIIIPSTPGSSKWSLSLRFPHQNPVHASPHPHKCYMPRPSHSSRTILGEEYRTLSSSLCSFLHSPITSSLLGPNILPNISQTSWAFVPPSMSATKFHTHTKQQTKL